MRIGLLGARAENRGLGNLTVEFARHVRPDRVLGVDLGALSPYENDWGRYAFDDWDGEPGLMRVVRWDGGALPDVDVDWLLDGVDVVYAAETPYDWRVLERARERGVATVVHAMPELWRPVYEPALPLPDAVWAPTHWRADRLYPPPRVVPVPVSADRLPEPRVRAAAATFLHVAGHAAARDRNGTLLVLEAARLVKAPVTILIRSQSPVPDDPYRPKGNARVVVERGDVASWGELYGDADVLLAPRRYGGLSMPMQEALAQGMPVVTLDVEPQRAWMPKEARVETSGSYACRMQGGDVDVWDADPARLAAKIDELASSPSTVEFLSRAAIAHGESISWTRWTDRYREMLAEESRLVAGRR